MALSDHPRAYGTAALAFAFTAGVLLTLGFKDSYPTYTRTAQQLRNEAWLYAQRAGRYAGVGDPALVLTERVVEISQDETEAWEAALKQRSI